jgi:hypothetical protein
VLLFRWVLTLLMGAAGVSFVLFIVTGQAKYKRFGLAIVKWTLLAALGFFLVLAAQRWFS